MARVKYDRDGEWGREAAVVQNCSINIWDGSEHSSSDPSQILILQFWTKAVQSNKRSSYFENNFPTFLLSGISNTSIYKVRDVLHWVNFFVTKTFSLFSEALSLGAGNIWLYYVQLIWSYVCPNYFYPIYYCQQVLFTLRVSSLSHWKLRDLQKYISSKK